jgi:hypothetical protein
MKGKPTVLSKQITPTQNTSLICCDILCKNQYHRSEVIANSGKMGGGVKFTNMKQRFHCICFMTNYRKQHLSIVCSYTLNEVDDSVANKKL